MGGIVLAASNEGQCAHCLRRSLTHKSEDCYGAGGLKQWNQNTNQWGASPEGANTSSMNFANASSTNLALNLNPQPFCSNHAFLICSDPEAISTETQMILDSGCTTHTCPHQNWFDQDTLIDLETSIPITVGDGQSIQAMAMGTIRIIMNINGEWLPATIPNVLYVPNMSSTLISVTNLTEREHTLYFKKEWCDIWTLGGRLVGHAKHRLRGDKLYHLLAEPYVTSPPPTPTFTALTLAVDINVLHCHLGHLSYDNI